MWPSVRTTRIEQEQAAFPCPFVVRLNSGPVATGWVGNSSASLLSFSPSLPLAHTSVVCAYGLICIWYRYLTPGTYQYLWAQLSKNRFVFIQRSFYFRPQQQQWYIFCLYTAAVFTFCINPFRTAVPF